MPPLQELGLIILAGGKSSRMGMDKALLELGELTLIERIVNKGRTYGFPEIIVVANETEKYSLHGVKMVKDRYEGYGPLAGIHSGLKSSGFAYNFVMPCDMPFFSFEIIDKLKTHQEGYQVIVPTMAEKFQPLAALYSRECIPYIEYLLEKNISKISRLYELVPTCHVELEEDSNFFNVNTPEDYRAARKFLKSR
ncbi:MAG: molybdenum cofactor guanylyltransferase [Peptococcaceae bacterium]